jgi:hypothetical protein
MPDDDTPKPHVKAHLDKNGVEWKDLKGKTRKALNEFSETEITKLDNLGTAFEDENLGTNMRISAVH